MSSLVDLMTEWYVCASKNRETTCVGPFKSSFEADDFYSKSTELTAMSNSTLLPVCILNPFKRYTVKHKYNNLFSGYFKFFKTTM